jgi:hypothetical protein
MSNLGDASLYPAGDTEWFGLQHLSSRRLAFHGRIGYRSCAHSQIAMILPSM